MRPVRGGLRRPRLHRRRHASCRAASRAPSSHDPADGGRAGGAHGRRRAWWSPWTGRPCSCRSSRSACTATRPGRWSWPGRCGRRWQAAGVAVRAVRAADGSARVRWRPEVRRAQACRRAAPRRRRRPHGRCRRRAARSRASAAGAPISRSTLTLPMASHTAARRLRDRPVQPLGAIGGGPRRPDRGVVECGGDQLADRDAPRTRRGASTPRAGGSRGRSPPGPPAPAAAGEPRSARNGVAPNEQVGERGPAPPKVVLDGEHRLAGVLRSHARAGADGELQPLGQLGRVGARAQRDPLLRGVEQAEARRRPPAASGRRRGPAGRAAARVRRGRLGDVRVERDLEAPGDASRPIVAGPGRTCPHQVRRGRSRSTTMPIMGAWSRPQALARRCCRAGTARCWWRCPTRGASPRSGRHWSAPRSRVSASWCRQPGRCSSCSTGRRASSTWRPCAGSRSSRPRTTGRARSWSCPWSSTGRTSPRWPG